TVDARCSLARLRAIDQIGAHVQCVSSRLDAFASFFAPLRSESRVGHGGLFGNQGILRQVTDFCSLQTRRKACITRHGVPRGHYQTGERKIRRASAAPPSRKRHSTSPIGALPSDRVCRTCSTSRPCLKG